MNWLDKSGWLGQCSVMFFSLSHLCDGISSSSPSLFFIAAMFLLRVPPWCDSTCLSPCRLHFLPISAIRLVYMPQVAALWSTFNDSDDKSSPPSLKSSNRLLQSVLCKFVGSPLLSPADQEKRSSKIEHHKLGLFSSKFEKRKIRNLGFCISQSGKHLHRKWSTDHALQASKIWRHSEPVAATTPSLKP